MFKLLFTPIIILPIVYPVFLFSAYSLFIWASSSFYPTTRLAHGIFSLNAVMWVQLNWNNGFSLLSSVAQSCPTLSDAVDWSMPDFRVYHQLSELMQTHVCKVGDAIQPSHPLSSPSPPTFNLSQHQGLFQRVSSLHQVTKVLELQLLG